MFRRFPIDKTGIIKLFLFLLIFNRFVFSQDSLQVVKLYQETEGANWINNDNWLSEKPLNDWYGITAIDMMVIAIDLQRNHLSGTIPEEIYALSSLRKLELSDNNLSGILPDSIGYLEYLDILNLSHNNLTGTIGNIVKSAENLTILDLSKNKFTGSIPKSIGRVKNLEILDLSDNNLIDKIPIDLFRLQKLTELNLKGNSLNGTIPRQIGNSVQLIFLDLSRNELSGNIPKEIGKLINLKERLALNHNQLSGSIPQEINSLTKLEYLWLNNNQLSGILPFGIGELTNLKSLFIYQNKFVGPLPHTLGNLRELEIFYAQNNRFSGNIPQELWFLPKLKMLKLENNQLSGSIPGDLRILKSIQSINLSNNRIDAITDTVSLPTSILSYNLTDNKLFCNKTDQNLVPNIVFSDNSLDKIMGLEKQNCSDEDWEPFSINVKNIDFDFVQTDSSAIKSFLLTSNNTRTNIIQIRNFDQSNFILSDSLINIEQGDTIKVDIIYSPISEGSHNDVILLNDIINKQTKYISIVGEGVETKLIERDTSIPWRLKLHPIPFSDGTEVTIKYDIPKVSNVNIAIYNLGGRPIKSLVNDNVEVGFHELIWDCTNDSGSKVEPGEFLCVMQSGMFIQIQHMMIIY